jgi:hypothetical protein
VHCAPNGTSLTTVLPQIPKRIFTKYDPQHLNSNYCLVYFKLGILIRGDNVENKLHTNLFGGNGGCQDQDQDHGGFNLL